MEEEGRKRGGGRWRREVEMEGRKRVERERGGGWRERGRRVEGERGSRSDIHSVTTMLNGRHFYSCLHFGLRSFIKTELKFMV